MIVTATGSWKSIRDRVEQIMDRIDQLEDEVRGYMQVEVKWLEQELKYIKDPETKNLVRQKLEELSEVLREAEDDPSLINNCELPIIDSDGPLKRSPQQKTSQPSLHLRC